MFYLEDLRSAVEEIDANNAAKSPYCRWPDANPHLSGRHQLTDWKEILSEISLAELNFDFDCTEEGQLTWEANFHIHR